MSPSSYNRPTRTEFREDKDAQIKWRRENNIFKSAKRMRRELLVRRFLDTAKYLSEILEIHWLDIYNAKEKNEDYNSARSKALRKQISEFVNVMVEAKWGEFALVDPEKRNLMDLPEGDAA